MRVLLTLLTFLIAMPIMAQTDELRGEAGYVDFGELNRYYGEPKVEINVGAALLGFVTAMTRNEDPEAAEVFSKLKGVRVYVYDTAEISNDSVGHINDVIGSLKSDNWTQVVKARDDGEIVNILMKMSGDIMEGLTVLAAGDEDEAVFINIIGQLDPEDLAQVTSKFDVDLDDIQINLD